MKKGLIGKKIGMTQIFNEEGKVIPVTVIEAGPCVVSQVKTEETDGYNSIQLGFGAIKESKVNKPERGHFTKANIAPARYLREFRVDSIEDVKVGDELKADIFMAGDKIDIQGTSKGKGFQGVIKRHGQHRGPMGHDLCIIEDLVQWDLHQHQVEFLKVKNYQDIWEQKQLQYKT